ncbi:hypothetical protein SCP_0705960 [Sparassis crispa]|uniref:Uncharacterized protein n=1 Tax=Sparassis crispa TaxID=139825 RepID=A0A401GTA7_9APHY|nr:hypothetical protein SCP_0705960 [Sparassis crispa]GBE85409.1 hypothetical protein SCP_0705960 [Sparassis crispa]
MTTDGQTSLANPGPKGVHDSTLALTQHLATLLATSPLRTPGKYPDTNHGYDNTAPIYPLSGSVYSDSEDLGFPFCSYALPAAITPLSEPAPKNAPVYDAWGPITLDALF